MAGSPIVSKCAKCGAMLVDSTTGVCDKCMVNWGFKKCDLCQGLIDTSNKCVKYQNKNVCVKCVSTLNNLVFDKVMENCYE